MPAKKITISDVNKKRLRIIAYLIISQGLGWLSATYIANNPTLSGIFGLAINFVIYSIVEELKNEGYVRVLKGK